MNTPKNQRTKATNQVPQRIFAIGAGTGQRRPNDLYDGEGEELSSVKRILFSDLSVDTNPPPASGPPFRRVDHIVEVLDHNGNIILEEAMLTDTPAVLIDGNTAYDAPLPFYRSATNPGEVSGRYIYWKKLPNGKFIMTEEWVPFEQQGSSKKQ